METSLEHCGLWGWRVKGLEVDWKTNRRWDWEWMPRALDTKWHAPAAQRVIYVSASAVQGVMGKKPSMVSREKGYVCEQIFHPTVAEAFRGNFACESIHQCVFIRGGQGYLTVRWSRFLPCLQSAGFDTSGFLPSCPPAVTFINSLPGGDFLC